MPEREDEDLLISAGKGDREAFGLLVERHHLAVVRFAYRFLGNVDRDTAEDLAQDVFLRAWRSAPSFRPRARVLTWLLRLATNACLNYQRGRRLRRAIHDPGRSAHTLPGSQTPPRQSGFGVP